MLLHGGRALRPGAAQVEPTDILIDSDRIVEVGARLARPSDVEAVDTRGFLILPGLINAHTHGHGHLLRRLAGRWTLEELRARAQEAADRARSRKRRRVAARGSACPIHRHRLPRRGGHPIPGEPLRRPAGGRPALRAAPLPGAPEPRQDYPESHSGEMESRR
jgi:hypothetical protein